MSLQADYRSIQVRVTEKSSILEMFVINHFMRFMGYISLKMKLVEDLPPMQIIMDSNPSRA